MKSAKQGEIVKRRAKRCKHHYPYFQRWYDDFSESGKMIERHCYCFICRKEFIIRMNPSHMNIERMDFGKDRTLSQIWRELPSSVNKFTKRVLERNNET